MLNAAERLATLAAGTACPPAPNVAVAQTVGVGGNTLSSFFGELDPDLELARSTLVKLGYDMSQEDVNPVLLDIQALGTDEFFSGLPGDTTLRAKAAFKRFLNMSSPFTSQETSQSTDSDLLLKTALRVAGMSDPVAEEAERLKHKQTVGELAQRLELGVFAPSLLPDADLLRKVSSAAQVGHFPQPDRKQLLDHEGPRAFAKQLWQILRSGIALLLMQRMSPAALFSELGLALQIASETPGDDQQAEKLAVLYSIKIRELLHGSSLNVPLNPDVDTKPFEEATQVFLHRDPGVFSEAKDSVCLEEGGAKAPSAPQARKPSLTDHCLRHAVKPNFCSGYGRKTCGFNHTCPFCQGKICQNKPGYLARHLASLRVPMEMVVREEGRSHKARSRSPRRRSRSRSRRRDRGDQNAARVSPEQRTPATPTSSRGKK